VLEVDFIQRSPAWPGKWQDSDMLEEDERRQYAARQYESLREEMTQARQSQQNILQWSQATALKYSDLWPPVSEF
jgi:hypothetical protein